MRNIGGNRRREPAPREAFTLTVMRNEEPEEHELNARAVSNVLTLAAAFANVDRHPEQALGGLMKLISNMLDNKDGTSASWTADPLPLPESAVLGEDEEPPVKFRAPNGELVEYTPENVERYTAFAAGSSRRRWKALLEDEDVEVDEDVLMELFKYLVSLAGKDRSPQSR